MKRIPDETCASICGLFCGACPAFPDKCHGCFSDYVREGCKNCADHGFLDCARKHNVLRCYECEQFPCEKLKEFSTKPIINGICNHENVIPDSLRMKKVGISQWIQEKIKDHQCPECGELISWFDVNSHTCGRNCSKIMNIRNMILDDFDDVYALWMSCEGMGLNNLDDSRNGVDAFLKRNPDTCFVAEYDRKLIGVIMVGNDGRRGYIYHTAVHPQYRKQGIASRLVDTALQALKLCGIHKVALVVFERNKNGNQFWENRGFMVRDNLVYRDKAITEMIRTDT